MWGYHIFTCEDIVSFLWICYHSVYHWLLYNKIASSRSFVCSHEKSIFFGLQFGCPYKFFQGLRDSFLCPLNTKTRLGHLASFILFGILKFCLRELVITLIAFDKKGNAVPVQTGLRFCDRRRTRTSQSMCIRDDLRFRSFTILDCGSPVWSGCKMKCFCCIYLFCSRTWLWIALALRWINSGNSHISWTTLSLHLLTKYDYAYSSSQSRNNHYCIASSTELLFTINSG